MATRPSRPNSVTVSSVRSFIDHVMTWEMDGLQPLVFRGQRAEHWKIFPTLLRSGSPFSDNEKDMVRDIVSMHPQEFRDDETMFDRLVRMQHHNLPTRLMDVTTNPLVALWFATEPAQRLDGGRNGAVIGFWVPDYRRKHYDSDVVSCLANLANLTGAEKQNLADGAQSTTANFNKRVVAKRLLYFIRQEKFDFAAKIEPIDLFRPVFVKPKLSNRRILAQSGAFIIYGLEAPGSIKPYDRDLRTLWIVVPERHKEEIRKQLARLGIHASVLFPEIDRAAEFIRNRYAGDVAT